MLAGAARREETLERVAALLPRAPAGLSKALCSALSRMLGEPYSYDRDEWLRWLSERRQVEAARPGDRRR